LLHEQAPCTAANTLLVTVLNLSNTASLLRKFNISTIYFSCFIVIRVLLTVLDIQHVTLNKNSNVNFKRLFDLGILNFDATLIYNQ